MFFWKRNTLTEKEKLEYETLVRNREHAIEQGNNRMNFLWLILGGAIYIFATTLIEFTKQLKEANPYLFFLGLLLVVSSGIAYLVSTDMDNTRRTSRAMKNFWESKLNEFEAKHSINAFSDIPELKFSSKIETYKKYGINVPIKDF
ncbi:hypothetical protein [Caldisericum exile]|uniref:Uncharacterized protein n=1 Tax=Caldisericum exile (strain DSM 21853 / NBRC 104410 / AZM16c01) TaxID=511051 RepID=A0A7U6JET2_CALEA|nr:hypothetical protein [Caldisericum exile]BAL80793.1 hypothetical protein CSE_06670 [Caldisericum exile AZM16c01]